MADFTPQQIEQFFDVVGARQYIGARYVPIFGRAGSDTVEWDDLAPYEPLTVVMHDGVSYVSRRYVPAGIEISDTAYWVETYRFNAQVEQYRQQVLAMQDDVDDRIPFPDPLHYPMYGTLGQVLSTLADGTVKWEDPVVPSDEQAEAVITGWLDDHPEATTTVLDDSITDAKLKQSISFAYPLDGQKFGITAGTANSLDITVPRRLVVCRNGSPVAVDFSERRTYNVPHNNCLVVTPANAIAVSTLSATLLGDKDIILAYNNTGVVSGPIAYAQAIDTLRANELRTGALVDGMYLQVNVSAKNAANTIDVTVPPYIIVFDDTNVGRSANLGSQTTYTLAHNDTLILNHSTSTLEVVNISSLSTRSDWTLLVYNNSGYAIGQWGYIQRLNGIIEVGKRFECEIIPIDVVGTTPQLFVGPPSSNKFTVTIPRRVAVYTYNQVGDAIDFGATQTFTVPHNGVLYYDHTDSTIKLGTVGNTLNLRPNWSLLLINNYGHAYGPWGKYQDDSLRSAPYTSLVFSSRQGDAGGFPENSLEGFRHSKLVGYGKVRGSCSFTSDGVGVMFHDEYLGTNSIVYDGNGNLVTDTTKKINQYTYAELQQYDFGLYKGERFRGTTICTLEDFVRNSKLCGQDIDIELKFGITESNMTAAYNLLIKYGMVNHTRFSNEVLTNLTFLKNLDPRLTLGLIIAPLNNLVDNAATLLSGQNEVWCCLMYSYISTTTEAFKQYMVSKGLKSKMASLNSGAQMRDNCGFDELEITTLEHPDWHILS